jgi:HAD-superfamily subfamily IB hydrolase, TIGR01490
MERKIAFFDFDDTLIKRDSMLHLLVYYTKSHPLAIFQWLKIFIYGILYFIKIIPFLSLKKEILYPISKMSSDELKEFYQNNLVKRYYPHVVSILKEKKKEGYLIFLVSASPEAYLIHTDLPVDFIIGTLLAQENGKYSNKIISKNCKHEEKVVRINKILKEENILIDYEHSFGYSDSTSDLPMLRLVKNRIRVDKKDASLSEFI